MREIIFRGKRPDEEFWRFGDLDNTGVGVVRIRNRNIEVRVDENTVGQFTGLYDMHGRKIWEGDVVIANLKYFDIKDEKCKVIFKGGAFGVQYGCSDEYFKTISAWDSLEVIGNIYENKELLKERLSGAKVEKR